MIEDNLQFTALVPMRHNSERVPGKNYRLFAGVPLYHYIIRSLMKCGRIDRIVIDTDSEWIAEDAGNIFPNVQVIRRPEALLGGEVPMNKVLLHDIGVCKSDFYIQTHSTNPLLKPATIAKALDTFLDGYPEKDSLFSVTRLKTRLWDKHGMPINHDPGKLLRTQDLPHVYEENSNIYIFTADSLKQSKNRIGRRPILFEIDREEAWDIDEESDFSIAEFIFTRQTDHGESGCSSGKFL